MIWNGNEIVLICSFAIKIHSDATPSYDLMWSIRRGLWWILTNSNLYLLTQNCVVVSLRSLLRIFPSFPNEGFTGFYWMRAHCWWFLSKYFPNGGFWVYISRCNPKRYPKIWYPALAWGECLKTLLSGWLRRPDGESVWVAVTVNLCEWRCSLSTTTDNPTLRR
jgi:hypothetical protein